MLDPAIFKEISEKFSQSVVDFMTFSINIQVSKFVSWKADRWAITLNTFYIPWDNIKGQHLLTFQFYRKGSGQYGI